MPQKEAKAQEDKDAAPVCGFTWIHWIAANITRAVLKENDSLTADTALKDRFFGLDYS